MAVNTAVMAIQGGSIPWLVFLVLDYDLIDFLVFSRRYIYPWVHILHIHEQIVEVPFDIRLLFTFKVVRQSLTEDETLVLVVLGCYFQESQKVPGVLLQTLRHT
jgi:hypothetical protein